MAFTAYKFRLWPNRTQEKALEQQLETLRRVYNSVLKYWNDKSDAWVAANPQTGEKKKRPKMSQEEREERRLQKEKEREERKNAPPKKKNHNKTPEQRAAEQEQWKKDRYPGLNEVYHFLTVLRATPRAEDDRHGPDPKYMTDSHLLASMMRDTAERVRKAFKRFWEIQRGEVVIPLQKKPRKDDRPNGYPRFKRHGQLTSIVFANYESGLVLLNPDGERVRKQTSVSLHPARRGYRIRLSCVGDVKVHVHREVSGVIKNATVSRDVDGKWYVAFGVERPDEPAPEKSSKPSTGIDVGLEFFATVDDDNRNRRHLNNPEYLKKTLPKLRTAQRKVSKHYEECKKKGKKLRDCKKWKRAVRRANQIHVRVRNQRKEHHHKTAHRLVKRYGVIGVEKLNVRGMVRNNKLSRRIADAAWAAFVTTLKQHAVKAGVSVVEVDPSGTSQTCPQCQGRVSKTLADRRHNCLHCGYQAHRDYASAQVIHARARAVVRAGPVPPAGASAVTAAACEKFLPAVSGQPK